MIIASLLLVWNIHILILSFLCGNQFSTQQSFAVKFEDYLTQFKTTFHHSRRKHYYHRLNQIFGNDSSQVLQKTLHWKLVGSCSKSIEVLRMPYRFQWEEIKLQDHLWYMVWSVMLVVQSLSDLNWKKCIHAVEFTLCLSKHKPQVPCITRYASMVWDLHL